MVLVAALIIGVSVGLLTGIFGVGGGFLMTPALMIFMGIPGPEAVGSGLSSIFFSSSFGLIKRRNTDTIDVKLAFIIASGSILGIWAGTAILESLKQVSTLQLFSHEVDVLQLVLLSLFVLLLASIALYLFWDDYRSGGRPPSIRVGKFSAFKVPPYLRFNSLECPMLPIIPLLILGIVVGAMTGLLGTGGGVILLPVLVYLVGQRAAKAAGTSLLLVWISSLIGVIFKLKAEDINFQLVAFLVIGGIMGTYFGTLLGLTFSGPQIRRYFAYVVLAAMLIVSVRLGTLVLGS